MIASVQDIEAMRRLRMIMESAEPKQVSGITESRSSLPNRSNQISSATKTTGRPEVDAMAEILYRFNKATSTTAERLVEDSKQNPRLHEAIHTNVTQNGVRIDKFEVVAAIVNDSLGKPQKVFNIVNANSQLIYEGLLLIEAAHAMVRYLNKGLLLEDNKIRGILELEETFSRNKLDAARFRYRYDRCVTLKEVKAGNIFADRFQVSRANALAAHDQIKSILESIR